MRMPESDHIGGVGPRRIRINLQTLIRQTISVAVIDLEEIEAYILKN